MVMATRCPRCPRGAGWRKRIHAAALGIGLLLLSVHPADADDVLWKMLHGGGQVVLLRHASTVAGLGDPPGFRLDDCATQRNLSDAGRAEARRIGETFRRRALPVSRVLSSRWCRCLETARLAFGAATPWEPLDSFFEDRSREAERTRAVRAELAGPLPVGNLVLVTHQVNITALTGIVPATGEMVILTPQPGGDFRVAGRLGPAAFSGN
jgi:phosphohistidine phosphatase SixA